MWTFNPLVNDEVNNTTMPTDSKFGLTPTDLKELSLGVLKDNILGTKIL